MPGCYKLAHCVFPLIISHLKVSYIILGSGVGDSHILVGGNAHQNRRSVTFQGLLAVFRLTELKLLSIRIFMDIQEQGLGFMTNCLYLSWYLLGVISCIATPFWIKVYHVLEDKHPTLFPSESPQAMFTLIWIQMSYSGGVKPENVLSSNYLSLTVIVNSLSGIMSKDYLLDL